MRLQDNQIERLQWMARRLGRTPSETSALLVEESLRQGEFGHIEFRDSLIGRQAYIKGSSLAVRTQHAALGERILSWGK